MTEEKPRRGRPPGTGQPRFQDTRSFRFMAADLADLERLAKAWRCTEAEALRRALREAAKREGIE